MLRKGMKVPLIAVRESIKIRKNEQQKLAIITRARRLTKQHQLVFVTRLDKALKEVWLIKNDRICWYQSAGDLEVDIQYWLGVAETQTRDEKKIVKIGCCLIPKGSFPRIKKIFNEAVTDGLFE